MAYGNNYGMPQPSNNLWVGNNYSSGYSQASRSPMGAIGAMNSMPTMQQPIQTLPSQLQTINNVLQVMGPESAQSYQVGPNSHVILMDSNRPVFYTKRSDDSGYSETKAFQFKEIPLFPEPVQTQPTNVIADTDLYVTKEDFNNFKTMMEDFKKMIEELVMKNE